MEQHYHASKDAQSEKIVELWQSIHYTVAEEKLRAKNLFENEMFHQLARHNQQVFMVTNFKNHALLSVSDNFNDIYEYDCTVEDMLKWNFFYFIRSISFDQIKAIFQISLWYQKLKKEKIEFPNYKQSHCGWRFKTKKTGKVKYLFTKQQGLEYSENGEPLVVLTTISDVTHLLKENPPFWCNISFKNQENFQYCYHSDKSKIVKGELLTERERDFLNAFENGLELKAISESLNISYKTADNHRANILSRIGARNPMAALEILKKMQ